MTNKQISEDPLGKGMDSLTPDPHLYAATWRLRCMSEDLEILSERLRRSFEARKERLETNRIFLDTYCDMLEEFSAELIRLHVRRIQLSNLARDIREEIDPKQTAEQRK